MLNPHQPDAAGFVLAGGQSSRMGQDKALLLFAGRPLIANALTILQSAGLSASIAGAQPSALSPLQAFAPVVSDACTGLGPLSGVCAALESSSAHYAVFLPVDLPFLPPSLLVSLLCYARATGCVVTVPSVNGFVQTFPAIVDRAILRTLQEALRAGNHGCFSAFQYAASSLGQTVRSVAVELLAQPGRVLHPDGLPPVRWFFNLNTPADLKRAETLAAGRVA
jgi:molybdenum cofactor guanylyltransferase